MKITIDIADSAYNYFKELAEDMGYPVEVLINNEVEALYCNALEDMWREEDFEEALKKKVDAWRWNERDE